MPGEAQKFQEILILARKFNKELMCEPLGELRLIHGDLHRGNILLHEGQWRVIDPKGY